MAESMLSSTTDTSQLPVVMRGMSQQAWEAYFRAMLPQETLKAMGDETLNSIFAYLNLQTNSVQISLIPLKASMVSDTGVQAVFTLLDTQPDCTLEQIAQMTFNLFNNNEIQFCKPPAELTTLLTPMIQGQMQFATQAIPDQLDLISAPPENDPRQALQSARMIMKLSPILPLAFLLLVTIAVVNSLKSWLNWWGVPLFVTGLLAMLMGLGGAPIFGAMLQGILANGLPSVMLGFANDLTSAMLQALLIPVLWQGLGIAVIGFGMAGVSYLTKHQK